MYDENAEFDLTAVAPRYPSMRIYEEGSWRTVSDDGLPIAIVWLMTAEPAGAGVVWLRQTEPVEKLYRHFVESSQAGLSPIEAYNSAELLDGVELAPEQRGPLSEVNDDLTAMMEVL